ncbi:MAG: hypothetical protein LBE65_02640 [Synergistaceae bacterium]|nr:hypothetical protein [Synergistaceae bacterium]
MTFSLAQIAPKTRHFHWPLTSAIKEKNLAGALKIDMRHMADRAPVILITEPPLVVKKSAAKFLNIVMLAVDVVSDEAMAYDSLGFQRFAAL